MSGRVVQFPRQQSRERALTVRELSDYLGMSTRWISYRVGEGMPSHRYGRGRRYRVSEVEAWLAENRLTG